MAGRPEKKSVLQLDRFFDKWVRVKFSGGREAVGILKGFDPLVNLVLDEAKEYLRDPEDAFKVMEETRELGLLVCRGTAVALICPVDGTEAIENPFAQAQDDDEG